MALDSLEGIAVQSRDAEHQSLTFFSLFLLLLGFLILTSPYVPKVFGWLLVGAAVLWIVALIPGVGARATAAIDAVGFLAEFALMLWLLAKGAADDPNTGAARSVEVEMR